VNRLKEEQREEKRRLLGLPIYSASEEILSAVSHGIGVLLSIAALVLLLVSAPGDPIVIVSLSIYSATLILLYLVSTLYHALGVNKGKRVFRILDHCSIFLLIAGTYTPLSLVIIGGTVGWVLFGVIWAAAVVGIVFNAVNLKRFQRLSMVCYICMGWAVIFAAKPLAGSMPFLGDDSFAGWRRFLYGRSGAVWNRKEKEVCAFPLASVRAGGKHIPFFLYLRLSVVKKHN